jgi:GNAT superfamily N-acetyltransferase
LVALVASVVTNPLAAERAHAGARFELCDAARVAPFIRSAVAEDADVVTEIYVTAWNARFVGHFPARDVTPELTERWRAQLAAPPPFRWWVAEINQAVVGFVGIGASRDPVDPTLGELDTIAVAPAHWRRGVGRELIRVAARHLQADAYEAAILWTVRGLASTERFYQRMGWRPERFTRDGGRQVRYRLDLTTR